MPFAQRVFVGILCLSEWTEITSVNSINKLVCLTGKCCSFLWGKCWNFKYYLDMLRLQRVKKSSAVKFLDLRLAVLYIQVKFEQGLTLILYQYEHVLPNLLVRPYASWFWSSKLAHHFLMSLGCKWMLDPLVTGRKHGHLIWTREMPLHTVTSWL